MPYAPITDPRILMALINGSAADVQSMMPFLQSAQYVSPQQANASYESYLGPSLSYDRAQEAVDTEADRQRQYYMQDVNRAVAADRARTNTGLGGTTNSFASARQSRISAAGSTDAQAVADQYRASTYNREADRISRLRAQVGGGPEFYDSFSASLGPWGSMIGSGTASRHSDPISLGGTSAPSYSGSTPSYSSYGLNYQPSYSSRPSVSSRIAQASTGLYELINQMRRNNIGPREVGQGIGATARGVLTAPAQVAKGLFGF